VETVSKDYLVDAGQGDRNTKFYHTCANQRSKINLISKISDELGVTWDSPEDIQVAFVNYFSNLFSAATIRDMELHIQPLSPRVIEEMNVTLRKVLPKKRLGLHSNKRHL
jgi:hypothetical protein